MAKPLVQVELAYRGRSLKRLAMVDSGADLSAVPSWMISDGFDIDLSSLPPGVDMHGVGGPVQTFSFDTALKWNGHLVAKPVTVFLVDETEEARRYNNFVLLGRQDFFQAFSVKFHWASDPPQFTIAHFPWVTEPVT